MKSNIAATRVILATSILLLASQATAYAIEPAQDSPQKPNVKKDVPSPIPQIHNPAHKGRICGLAISRQGTMVATGSSDGRVIIWPLSGQPRTLDCKAREVWSLAFSPDEKQLAVGADGCVELVNPLSLDVLWRKNGEALFRDVAFSDDGKLVAVVTDVQIEPGGESCKSVEVLDAKNGSLRRLLTCDDRLLKYVLFVKAGRQILAYGDQGLYLWDTESGKLLRKLPHELFGGFDVSPKGDLVAAAHGYDSVNVLDLGNGQLLHRLNLRQAGGYSDYPVKFSPDGKLLATGFGGILLWDTTTGLPLKSLTEELTCNLCFSPDGKTLVSSQNDGRVEQWDISGVVATTGNPEIRRLNRRDVVLQQGKGSYQQPCGLFAIGDKPGDAAGNLDFVYQAALKQKAPAGTTALIGFSEIARGRTKDDVHVTQAEVLDYTRQGNHILMRVKYVYDTDWEPGAVTVVDQYSYVKAKLPHLEPGRYHAAILFDEYKGEHYIKPAADTVFTEFQVEDNAEHAASKR